MTLPRPPSRCWRLLRAPHRRRRNGRCRRRRPDCRLVQKPQPRHSCPHSICWRKPLCRHHSRALANGKLCGGQSPFLRRNERKEKPGEELLTARPRDSGDRRDLPALPGYLDSRIRGNERKEKPGGELLTARPRESGDPVIDPDSRLRGNDRLDLLHLPRAATAQAGALGRAWRRSCAPSAINNSEAITAIKVSKTVCKMAPNTRPIMPAIEPVTMMPRPISAKTARSTASHGITATKKIAKIRSAQPLVSSSA